MVYVYVYMWWICAMNMREAYGSNVCMRGICIRYYYRYAWESCKEKCTNWYMLVIYAWGMSNAWMLMNEW